MTSFSSSGFCATTRMLLLFWLFTAITTVLAQPLAPRQSGSASGGDIYIPTTGSSGDASSNDAGYVDTPGTSQSLFVHLSPWKIGLIIAGALLFALFGIIALVFGYLRYRTRLEVKEERRRTALRMSMMEQDKARRRKSQMVILEALDRLRDDPEERPALPPRASMLPGGVLQAGAMNGNKGGFGGLTVVPLEDEDEDKVFSAKEERKTGFI